VPFDSESKYWVEAMLDGEDCGSRNAHSERSRTAFGVAAPTRAKLRPPQLAASFGLAVPASAASVYPQKSIQKYLKFQHQPMSSIDASDSPARALRIAGLSGFSTLSQSRDGPGRCRAVTQPRWSA
jgi:hypothetical protein